MKKFLLLCFLLQFYISGYAQIEEQLKDVNYFLRTNVGLTFGVPNIDNEFISYKDDRRPKVMVGPSFGLGGGLKLNKNMELLLNFSLVNYRAGAKSGQFLQGFSNFNNGFDTLKNYQVTSTFDFWYIKNTFKVNLRLGPERKFYISFGGSYFKEFKNNNKDSFKGLSYGDYVCCSGFVEYYPNPRFEDFERQNSRETVKFGGQIGGGYEKVLNNLHAVRIEVGFNYLGKVEDHYFNDIYLILGYDLFRVKKKVKGYWD